MSASSSPVDPGQESDVDGSRHEKESQMMREVEEERHETGSVHDKSTNGGKNAPQVDSIVVEKDDNDSVLSWAATSDGGEVPFTEATPPVRPLGLSRRAGWSDYNDYDVVTVHGARDDHQTMWTSRGDNSDWIEDKLFCNLSIRQLDYVYDNGDSARIYNPDANGITMEAIALLESLAKNRLELFDTERDRPIIWICHDLGGSIVKEALIMAMQKQPDLDSQDDTQDGTASSMALTKMYRRLPLLTSTIIFLGCPHGNESREGLEDQLFSLMCLPGPPMTSRMLSKITNLARQIERTNLEFLETKVLDRAAILNITTGPEKQEKANAANETQVEQQPEQQNEANAANETQSEQQPEQQDEANAANETQTEQPEQQIEANRQTSDAPMTPTGLFSLCKGGMFHTLGIYYMLCLQTTDHLGLVRGPDPSGADPFDWAASFSELFNERLGYTIKNLYASLGVQTSLLSILPPTRTIEYRFTNDGFRRPALISWIIEHDLFDRTIFWRSAPKTVYIHAGQKHGLVDMKRVSQQLYVAYDLVKKGENDRAPYFGCFYFEFDRHDSRRSGIRAMIISFLCTYSFRFGNDGDQMTEFTEAYLKDFKCWSLRDLITVFLRVRISNGTKDMTIVLGQIDQCDKEERSIFLQAVLRRQKWNDRYFNLIITTTRQEESIEGILPPNSIISLEECPLSLEAYLTHPSQSGANEHGMQQLLLERPEFADFSPQLNQIFAQFRNVPSLQDTVSMWLANHRSGAPAEEASDIIQEVSSDAHQRLLQGLIDRHSSEEQHILKHTYKWIKFAAEPLTLEILVDAIKLSLPPEMARSQHTQSHIEFGRFVKKSLEGIILLDGRDIRFSDDAFYGVSETEKVIDTQNQTCRSHADIATACLRYLLADKGQEMLHSLMSVESHGLDDNDLSWSPMMLPRDSLVSYALRFWTTHYQAAGDYRPTDLATELFGDRRKMGAWAEAVYLTSNPFTRIRKGYISSLPYMAMFGLDDLVRREIDSDKKPDGWNQDKWLAIVEAARHGHEKTVTLLLEHTNPDVAGLAEALHWAANYGEGGALDCLISRARGLEGFRWPPFILNRAMAAGLENLSSALVDTGYDLDEEDSSGKGRAIHTAIEYGQDRVLKILLDSGRVDLTPEQGEGLSPLALAAEVGNPESIRHLLGAGARLNEPEGLEDRLVLKAIKGANHEALGVLIDAIMPINSEIVNKISDEDNLLIPVIEAATMGFGGCTCALLDRGADPNAVSQDGTVLYQAVDKGPYPEICRKLLEKGAKPNESGAQTSDEATSAGGLPLIRATEVGTKYLVKMLLNHNADINVTDPGRVEWNTPLSAAIVAAQFDIVELLLNRGADPNLVSKREPHPETPLLTAANKVFNPRFAQILIEKGAKLDWVRGDGWTVTHAAYDVPEILSLVLAKGADVNATDNGNWTALTMMADDNFPKSIEVLLKQSNPSVKLDVMTTLDPSYGAIHCASFKGNVVALKLLLDAGADINCQRSDGVFPLGQILESGLSPSDCEDIVDFTLKRKPNLGLVDDRGNTVLHYIAADTPLSVVMRLVEEGAPVNTLNNMGRNPLALAVSRGNIAAARYLATVKGSQTAVYHPEFGSILHIAASTSTVEMVRLLVRTGAEPGTVDPKYEESVLYSALGRSDDHERKKIIRYLVEEVGVDVNAPGGKYGYPLVRVVADTFWNNSLLKYLLHKGARPDTADSLGRTAMHWAAIRSNLDEMKLLVKFGADLSVSDNFGRTPLHFAATRDAQHIIEYILENTPNGSDSSSTVEAADMDGWTPLMWACRAYISGSARVLVDEYKADILVRSKDAEWSPLKLARFHDQNDELTEVLKVGTDATDLEKERESQDNETACGTRRWNRECDSCRSGPLMGQVWLCKTCNVELCFKCIRHREKMHDPKHDFIDLDEFEREQSVDEVDADRSEHGGKSRNGSENEEDEESSESESEEEEDDESE